MLKKRKKDDQQDSPKLQVPLAHAQRLLQERIDLAQPLLNREILNEEMLDEAEAAYREWRDYNTALLRQLFSNASISEEHTNCSVGGFCLNPSLHEMIEHHADNVRTKLNKLKSIYGRLPLYDSGFAATSKQSQQDLPEYSRRVFVIHGHDDAIKSEVARLLERLGFEAVILHEQPNRGRTIIEKFEDYSDVGFAVALLTPDDVGAKQQPSGMSPDLVPRARQNVIFELGFFIGKLSRSRVVALHKESTELLTDISGVLYTRIDSSGAWKLKLAKELQAAGYSVDLNRIP